MPPTPARTDDELKRIIGSLNDGYDLGIEYPDPLLTPSKRRQLLRTEEQRRSHEIYHKLHVLHFQQRTELSTCLGRFHVESQTDLTSSHAERQDRLLHILAGAALPSRPKPAKRPSEGPPDAQAKRPRSREGFAHPGKSDAVDSIPVRSSTQSQPQPLWPSIGEQSLGSTSASHLTSDSATVQSTSSTRTSFTSRTSFSTSSGKPPSTQPSFDGILSQDHFPLGTQECQALDESFRIFDKSTDIGGSAGDVSPQLEVTALPLEKRLKDVWPKLPASGFNEAPLAVLWEATRISQHCKVEPCDWGLTYLPSVSWHDQFKLRGMFANRSPFLGKGLPHASQTKAWELALDTFQSPTEAVTLSAELVCRSDKTGPLFELRLNPLKLDVGHRLNRRFGADRFLLIDMPSPTSPKCRPAAFKNDEDYFNSFRQWLTGKSHFFLGRSWVPFFVRKFQKTTQSAEGPRNQYLDRVIFFASDGLQFRIPYTRGGIPPLEEALKPWTRTKMKRSALLEWAISLQHNSLQPVMKLFSRLALSLTRTYPTVVLEPNQIRHKVKDIGTHKVMNDGAGRMSRSLARKIADRLGLDHTPAGFQGRIGSAKGYWFIDVDDDGLENNDWIETYPSQVKWKCDFRDVHHRTFEVNKWPGDVKSASLNQQFIPLLLEQAVDRDAMRQTLAEHLESSLMSEIDAQMACLGHPADLRLWLGQSGQSRSDRVLHGHLPFLAGLPKSHEDAISYLVDSGFKPGDLKYIQTRCQSLVRKRVADLEQKTHIRIPRSAYLTMAPDFTGELNEGEVHVSFSPEFKVEGFCDTLLENMDVLVARSPAHLLSDIQKVRAVTHHKLRKLKNVIVFSTKGVSSLADKLSGGDFDGDIAWVCFDPKIVNNFENITVPQCLDLIKAGYLSKRHETFDDLRKPGASFDENCDRFADVAFEFNMEPSHLGKCTKFKEKLSYNQNTVNSHELVILSSLLGHLVDQSKQGIVFNKSAWDRVRNDLIKPGYLVDPDYENAKPSIGPKKEGEKHILDYLRFDVAARVVERGLADLERAFKDSGAQTFDSDLMIMYNNYEEEAKSSEMWKELLQQLRKDMAAVKTEYQSMINASRPGQNDYRAKVEMIYQKWLDIMPSEKVRTLEPVKVLMEGWSKDPQSTPWALLKASATFKYYHANENFTWLMAGRQLCIIKSKMTRSERGTWPAVVQPELYASLRPDKKFIMARGAKRGTGLGKDSVAAVEEVMELDNCNVELDTLQDDDVLGGM